MAVVAVGNLTSRKPLADWQKISLALILGIIAGQLIPSIIIKLSPIGTIFLNSIKMLLLPVICTAVTNAMLSLSKGHEVKKIFTKAIIFYSISMIIASAFGLSLGSMLLPYDNLIFATGNTTNIVPPSFQEMLSNLIPANPVSAFVDANILQVVILSMLLGIAINMADQKAVLVRQFFGEASKVVFKLVKIIMRFAPIGIFVIVGNTVAEFGWQVLLQLFSYVAVTCLCFLLFIIIYHGSLLKFYAQISFSKFIKDILEAILMAFTTSSSAATLPVSMKCAEEKLGVEKSVANFLLPLGSVLNLNGLAIYLTVATSFTAHMIGIDLTFTQHVTVIATVVLTALGAGGIPGSAMIVMSAALSSVNLPLAVIPLLASVDRLIDMPQTTMNVISDLSSCYLIAKSENCLEEQEK